MASATTIRIAATANVIRMPVATASGVRRRDVDRRRCEREHSAHDGCTGDEPEIARQVEHAGNDAPLVRADIRHDGGVVGRLEQRIAGGDDDDGGDVAGDAERRRHHGEDEGTGRHSDEPDDGHALCAETVRNATGRHTGQRGDQRTDRQDEPDHEPRRARAHERDRTARPPASPSSPSRRARSWRGSHSAPDRGTSPIGSKVMRLSPRRARRGRLRRRQPTAEPC